MSMLNRDAAGPCLSARGSVVCIGAFDGVHLGHQSILAQVASRAKTLGLHAIAVSFEPLPREFFARGTIVAKLTSAREKFERMVALGVDRVLLLRFTASLAAMTAEAFIASVLVERLAAKEIWVGQGFRFGHGRAGDLGFLRQRGEHYGFRAAAVEPVALDGERISSSRIRAALAEDRYPDAARLLGRPYTIAGKVVRGAQLGRKLGFPTANLRLRRRVAPVQGIFAVRVHGVQSRVWPGVASLGVRPTVNGTEPLLEAHLFDFDGDLYGKRIEVEFVEKIREEEKFQNLDALVQQMGRDAQRARTILGMAVSERLGA